MLTPIYTIFNTIIMIVNNRSTAAYVYAILNSSSNIEEDVVTLVILWRPFWILHANNVE